MRRSKRLTTKKSTYAASNSSNEDEAEDIKTTKKSKTSHITSNQLTNAITKHNNEKTFSQNKQYKKNKNSDDGSSSESDIENYLQPADKIDLNSDFFQIKKHIEETTSFDTIENNIFGGINRLSDPESENELEENETSVEKLENNEQSRNKDKNIANAKVSFQQLQEYTKKIEEAKKVVQKYEAKKKTKQGKQRLSLNKQAKEEKLNVSQLLALGETKTDSLTELQNTSQMNGFEFHSDSEKEDWEEVEEGDNKESKNIIPKDGLQVTVELPGVMRKKKGVDLMASIKRRLNRIRKENQVLVHKVHLLCWIAHGNFINETVNNETLLGMALSLVPSDLCRLKKSINLKYLEKIVKWYQGAISNIDKPVSKEISLLQLVKLQISNKKAFSKEMLVYIFVCMLRSLGIECRIVFSFQVAPLRPPENELHSLSTKNNDNNKNNKKRKSKQDSSDYSDEDDTENVVKTNEKEQTYESQDLNIKEEMKINNKKPIKKNDKKQINAESNDDVENVNVEDKSNKEQYNGETDVKINTINGKDKAKGKDVPPKIKNKRTKKEIHNNSKISKAKLRNKVKKDLNSSKIQKKSTRLSTRKIPQLDGTVDSDGESLTDEHEKVLSRRNIKRQSMRKKSLPTYAELDSEDDFVPKTSKSPRMSMINNNSNNNKQKGTEDTKHTKPKLNGNAKKGATTKTSRRLQKQNDGDSDYAPEVIKKKQVDSEDEYYESTEVKAKPKLKIKKENTIKVPKSKKGLDVWVEIYLKTEQKWISIDVIKGQINCVSELYSRASHPITYIVAWNNNNTIRDVTQRYCPNCNTVTRKLRVDKNWWSDSIQPFQGEKTKYDKKEDDELTRMQLEKPLPTTISEYKNHPLYVLKRHLLKFQALYPPEPIILGFIRKEAVYPRDCVYTLYSREKWIKQAKVVKPGEKPYKIVTRPVWDKINRQILKDQPLEIFGEWQVQDYEPPTAENGIVPRNEYGNVELFKPCMLPKRTVHIKLEGLNKTARKMGIDCAPALTGFDVHHGWIHPVYEGYVVCEENEEILIAAWHMEQEEQEKRDTEKREKRVYGNWKKLIKGLLIRERLNARYNFTEPIKATESEISTKKRKLKKSKLTSRKRRAANNNEFDSDDGNE